MRDTTIGKEGADRLTERSGSAKFTLIREILTVN
jgi:hypothetical protein